MSKELNKGLKLNEGEQVEFTTKGDSQIVGWKIYFAILWMGASFFLIMGTVFSYVLSEFFWFYVTFSFLIIFNILLLFLIDIALSIFNAELYITNNRIILVNGIGLFKFKRKNKEINLQDISYIQIWTDKFEIAKKRDDGVDKYSGSEEKFRLWYFKRYFSISLSINKALNSEITKKIINAIPENISYVKHPNLEGILLFKT